jgi:uncharacterized protein (DUF1697 family)
MGKHIALLRGINVGGKNPLPMKKLVKMFEKAGCTDVKTYIQSGNVVFESKNPNRIAAVLKMPVVLRTAEELARVVTKNPWPKSVDILHVAFLADEPKKATVDALDPKRSPGDEWIVTGRDMYLRLPNGVGKTKITNAWLDAKLETTSTLRNWRTVLKLVEMSS